MGFQKFGCTHYRAKYFTITTPHPGPMASHARHKMGAPSYEIASRNVVPIWCGEGELSTVGW